MSLALRKPPLTEASSLPLEAGRKLGAVELAVVWQVLHENPQCPSRVVRDQVVQRQVTMNVSVRHLNRLRAKWKLNRPKGRPRHSGLSRPVCAVGALVQVTPHLSFVGVHLFARWLDQQGCFTPVVARLKQAIAVYQQRHPDADFALLHHRDQTLLGRLQALFFSPLAGLEQWTRFDTQEHPLETLLGRGYHSSTLRQFLGQLERIDAAEALMPILLPQTAGQITYVDGVMIAYWSRLAMHKGKITMLGRIMAGSQALIAHNEKGQALFVTYHPPDVHISQVIVAYCHQVAKTTGVPLFVIDRAVNAVALACAFDEQGLGLLCMLDDNEYDGLERFEVTVIDRLADGITL